MRIVKPSRIREFYGQYPDAESGLKAWLTAAKGATWNNIADVRRTYSSADGVPVPDGRTVTVFNIGGNKYRLITVIKYATKIVYVKAFLTHAEYSKDRWKNL